jgi:hypothetical protein
MKKIILSFVALSAIALTSCSSDDDNNSILPVDPVDPTEPVATFAKVVLDIDLDGVEIPETYDFLRGGMTTVAYPGQTTRIGMAAELTNDALKDDSSTPEKLNNMFREGTDFSDASLTGKKLREKTGDSDLFGTSEKAAIKTYFDALIADQTSNVFPSWGATAASGVAGQIADGTSTRYVNGKGIENNQIFAKGLIGALQVDQAINGYMTKVENDDNEASGLAAGEYTTMEHHFDEAYGYLMNPSDGSFFQKYLGKVKDNPNFIGIDSQIDEAFRIARQAIIDEKYAVRDQAIEVLRWQVSRVIAIRTIHYLQAGKNAIDPDNMGGAFHDLSEGIGFVYSLRFVRKSDEVAAYFTMEEVDGFIADLTEGNGLWDVTPATLDSICEDIAAKFDFTVEEAAL